MAMMSMGQTPNLKPFRNEDAYEVNDLFAHVSGDANKGTLVYISAAQNPTGNLNVLQNQSDPPTPYNAPGYDNATVDNVPSTVYFPTYSSALRVDTTVSGVVPFGVLLDDVRSTDQWGGDLYWDRRRRYEGDITYSGEPVRVLTRGTVTINGFVGTPAPGSGAFVSNTTPGRVEVATLPIAKANVGYVGKWLTASDGDGYAVLKIEL